MFCLWIPFVILLLSLPLLLCQPPSTGRRPMVGKRNPCASSANDQLYDLQQMVLLILHLMVQFPHVKLSWTRPLCRTWLSNFTFTFHFHALEKEMATHSSVLAWRIPGTGKPGGLPSTVSHRVGQDWSDLAAAAADHCAVSFCEKELYP